MLSRWFLHRFDFSQQYEFASCLSWEQSRCLNIHESRRCRWHSSSLQTRTAHTFAPQPVHPVHTARLPSQTLPLKLFQSHYTNRLQGRLCITKLTVSKVSAPFYLPLNVAHSNGTFNRQLTGQLSQTMQQNDVEFPIYKLCSNQTNRQCDQWTYAIR